MLAWPAAGTEIWQLNQTSYPGVAVTVPPPNIMPYSPKVIDTVKRAPKTLGNQLGRWAVHLDFSIIRISKATGASRQTVYNWFNGGEVFVAYRPAAESLLKILQSSSTADEAWRKTCKAFALNN